MVDGCNGGWMQWWMDAMVDGCNGGWMQWPPIKVQITDTEKDIADTTTNGCKVHIPSGCNNCRWMHPSIAVECNDITFAKVCIVERTPNYHYMGPCLVVSADGSWRVRKRHTVIIVNQEVHL